jgi:predicted nucleotidyltransferase
MIEIQEIVEILQKIKIIEKIILFGSRVKYPDKTESDIDFCFVVDINSDTDIIYEKVSEIITQSKTLIHPVIYTTQEFNEKIRIKVFKESFIEKGKLVYQRKNNKA